MPTLAWLQAPPLAPLLCLHLGVLTLRHQASPPSLTPTSASPGPSCSNLRPRPQLPPQMLKGGRPSVHFYLRPRLRPTQAPPRARAARAARAPRSSSTCRPRPPSQWAPPPRASRPAPPLVPQPPVAWPQSCAGGGRLSYLSVTAAEACRSCSWGLPSHHVAERGGEPAG